MTIALLAVDVQWDFIDGSMGALARLAVIEPLLKLRPIVSLVVASQDWHPPNHCSFEAMGGPWPEHCVQNTHGAELHPEIKNITHFCVRKGMNEYLEAYSAFDNSELKPLLDRYNIETMIIGGLCTDYCVKASAIDSVKQGFHTIVSLPACQGVSKNSTEASLAEMEVAGVSLLRG